MASSIKEYKTFVKGIITEASPLTFPENASLDEENFVPKRDGSRSRRLGMEIEESYVSILTSLVSLSEQAAYQTYRWDASDKYGVKTFIVVQAGLALYFFEADSNSLSPSLHTSASLAGYQTGQFSDPSTINVSFAAGKGKLFVAGKHIVPLYFYLDENGALLQSRVDIQIRDFEGLDDGLAISERPATLSVEHKYNLMNQGWSITNVLDIQEGSYVIKGGVVYRCIQNHTSSSISEPGVGASWSAYWAVNEDQSKAASLWALGTSYKAAYVPDIGIFAYLKNSKPADDFYSGAGVYPSNCDVWSLGKKVDPKTGNEIWSWDQYKINNIGNTPAPKGRYITSPFYIDYSDLSGVTGITPKIDKSRPSCVAFYSGRVFFSGLRSESSFNNSSKVFFSKIIENDDDIGKCYQEADPTSDHVSDLVDTDGGVIVIPEANTIKKLVPYRGSIVVFADNGVWEISGGGASFTATNYAVRKVSNVGSLSSDSIVEVEGFILYWAESGIYSIQADGNSVDGLLTSTNISLNTIQTLYDDILVSARRKAKGFYDTASKTVRWLYHSTDDAFISNSYDSELVLDISLQAYYKNKITQHPSYWIVGAATYPTIGSGTIQLDVITSSGNSVTTSLGDTVVVNSRVAAGLSPQAKYTVITRDGSNYYITFAQYKNSSFLDWGAYNYTSYLITGYDAFGIDSARTKQTGYLVCHFRRTETGFGLVGGSLELLNPSSCLVTARWDFADSSSGGLIGQQFQAYRLVRPYLPSGAGDSFAYGQSVVTTKNRLRGRGKVLSIRFESEEGKDMNILGWAVSIEGRATV